MYNLVKDASLIVNGFDDGTSVTVEFSNLSGFKLSQYNSYNNEYFYKKFKRSPLGRLINLDETTIIAQRKTFETLLAFRNMSYSINDNPAR